jgi:phosphonopyruvate decarboxylase
MIAPAPDQAHAGGWTRHAALSGLLARIAPEDAVVASTGYIARDLHDQLLGSGRGVRQAFLCVGAMGHASQIACGVALARPERRVWCLDGDGAMLMHLGGLATIGSVAPRNLVHAAIDNGMHASVGGMATCAPGIDFGAVARAAGYRVVAAIDSAAALDVLPDTALGEGPCFLHVRVAPGETTRLGRPPEPLEALGQAFREFLVP